MLGSSTLHGFLPKCCVLLSSILLIGCGPGDPETDLRWSSISHKAGFNPIEVTRLQGPIGATPNKLVAGVYRVEGRYIWPETDPPANQIGLARLEFHSLGWETEKAVLEVEPVDEAWPETFFSLSLVLHTEVDENECNSFSRDRGRYSFDRRSGPDGCGVPGLYISASAGYRNDFSFDEVTFYDWDDTSIESMTSAAQSIHQGIGIERANLWEPGVPAQILPINSERSLFLAGSTFIALDDYMEALPEPLAARSLDDLNLILVIGERQQGSTGEACTYTGGAAGTLRTEKRNLKLVIARTAEIISEEVIEGRMPLFCPGTVTTNGGAIIDGDFLGEVTTEAAVSWALGNIENLNQQ